MGGWASIKRINAENERCIYSNILNRIYFTIRMEKKKVIVGLVVIAVIALGVYWYRMQANNDADPFAEYKMAMMRDDVGGATPAETLVMFIAALRANDVEAAAEFFMLDDNSSRAKWQTRMADLKAQGLFPQMADDIEKNAKPTSPAYEGDAGYELLNDDGTVGAILDMELNTFSGVWKLQSL